jgi:UDP-2-acetamido-3-amino-2,3-dideoxy-glucuronate N-acetyltransferase
VQVKSFFKHEAAVVEDGVSIGRGTRVWAFAHVLKGAIIGRDCNICDHTFIEGGVRVGNRVTIKCGVSLWNGLTLESDVFIGPHAVFTNDDRPRSRKHPREYIKTLLKRGCTIGANSTILPGLTIGSWAMVGAGAVVTRTVPDFALVFGNPARLKGWVCECGQNLVSRSDGKLICSCGLAYKHVAEEQVRRLLQEARRPVPVGQSTN